MSELDMVRLNVNANVSSAGQASSVGALGGGQAQLVQSSPQLNAMDKMAVDMTVPGGNNLADLSKKLETVSLDGSAKVAQGMQNMGPANSYLSECDNKCAAPQAKPLSGMKAELGQANQAAAPKKPQEAAAAAENVPAPKNPIGQCLDTCFGEKMPAAEKQSVAEFYGKGAASNAGANPMPKMEVPQASKAPQAQPVPQAPHAPQEVKAPQAQAAPQAFRAPQAQGAQPKAAPPKAAPAQHTQPQQPAKQAVPNNNGAKNVPSHNESAVRSESAVKEEAAPASRFEDQGGRFGLDDNLAAGVGMGEAQHVNSVLSQYKAQTEGGLNQSGIVIGDNLAGQPLGAGMEMPFNQASGFAGFGAQGVGLPVDGGNPMVNAEGAAKQQTFPLDMVGSTAMSTNMANLEQLVNMDLMSKFTSGMSMQ